MSEVQLGIFDGETPDRTAGFTLDKRVVRNGHPTNELVVTASTDGNENVFPRVLNLYVQPGALVADVTFGKGVFWRRVEPSRYRVLPSDIQDGVDCRNLPYGDEEIDCVVLDPPYMHSPGGTAHESHSAFEEHYRNNGSGNRTESKYHEAVLDLYRDAGIEAFRVLRERGVLIVKCQDEVCSNRQRFTHVEIIAAYGEIGFVAEDLFVVVRKNRPGVSRVVQQVHARKNHSSFLSLLEARTERRYMGTSRMSAVELMVEIIRKHQLASKWTGSPLEGFRHVANTNRGEIGEEFIVSYLQQYGIPVSNGSRLSRTDLKIAGKRFEVKAASEDTNGGFQFNHIRYDRDYEYLLCLGIRPTSIVFNSWSKGAVSEGKAGRMVRMAEGQSVTFKLTKRLDDMMSIEELPDWISDNISASA